MRGKEAARAANRRANEAQLEASALKDRLDTERAAHSAALVEWKAKVAHLEYDQDRRIDEAVQAKVGVWRAEYETKIAELVGDHERCSSEALKLIYDLVSPTEFHEVAEVLGSSASAIESARFLEGHPDFGCGHTERVLPNRRVKRAIARIDERKAKTMAEAGERDAELRPAKYASKSEGDRLGPYQGKANGKIGHC